MTRYVLIETRDPFESRDTEFVEDTAIALKQRGHDVTVFLVQNGVLASRKRACAAYLARLAQAGITLLADDFSLRERGIQPSQMYTGIRRSEIEALVDILIDENAKAIWH